MQKKKRKMHQEKRENTSYSNANRHTKLTKRAPSVLAHFLLLLWTSSLTYANISTACYNVSGTFVTVCPTHNHDNGALQTCCSPTTLPPAFPVLQHPYHSAGVVRSAAGPHLLKGNKLGKWMRKTTCKLINRNHMQLYKLQLCYMWSNKQLPTTELGNGCSTPCVSRKYCKIQEH